MKPFCTFLWIVVMIWSVARANAAEGKTPADLANALMGTDSNYEVSRGNTYPAIALPFGMTAWTPQTGMGNWIYQYSKDSLQGIRGTHNPSVWLSDYGNFTLMPLTGKLKVDPTERASKFNHRREVAKPYYYQVFLEDYGINVEVTPAMRSAILRFAFPESQQAFLLIDANPGGGFVQVFPEEQKIVGYNAQGNTPKDFRCYFVIRLSKAFSTYGTWNMFGVYDESKQEEGHHVGAFVGFATSAQEVIQARIGTSFISIEQADKNLAREIPNWNFEEAKDRARNEWNKELGRIEIEGGTDEQRATFYTALYRALLFPRTLYEFKGEGERIHRSPYDLQVRQGAMYADTGFWDTYRAQFPLLALLQPKRVAEIIQGLVNAYEQGGWMPKWPSPGYTNVMIGTHADSVVADAYLKGIRDYDVSKAYAALLKNAMEKGTRGYVARAGIEYYKRLGYIPADRVREATSRTLEIAYDDFCIAEMAKAMGKLDDYRLLARRARNYQNVFDPSSRFMRGKNLDGSWLEPFDPLAWGDPYTEGGAWHYLWSVQQDVPGLIHLLGGREGFTQKLDALFAIPPEFKVGSYKRLIHEMTEMQMINMGQYAHNNEPVHHVIYLYNYVGEPWKTQRLARHIVETLYNSGPQGLIGDEDTGQTSAWYIFSTLGFYPPCPGQLIYVIGSPLFSQATIHLPGGKDFLIRAVNNSPRNKYIQSATLNGKPLENTWFSHELLMAGGELVFKMGSEPNPSWGSRPENFPPGAME